MVVITVLRPGVGKAAQGRHFFSAGGTIPTRPSESGLVTRRHAHDETRANALWRYARFRICEYGPDDEAGKKKAKNKGAAKR